MRRILSATSLKRRITLALRHERSAPSSGSFGLLVGIYIFYENQSTESFKEGVFIFPRSWRSKARFETFTYKSSPLTPSRINDYQLKGSYLLSGNRTYQKCLVNSTKPIPTTFCLRRLCEDHQENQKELSSPVLLP